MNVFYPYFELAFRYLVDPNGLGRTMADVRDMLLDQRTGTSFSDAFRAHMGISVDEYETSFLSRMAEYLAP